LFIRNITTDSNDASISEAIIAMAQSLRMDVIAEGVETREQKEFLFGRDCFSMQGYYFCRPVPAEKISQMLGNGTIMGNMHLLPTKTASCQKSGPRLSGLILL
jgi:EAL domain-containing protein (putative c-di-GMP-specific phosphodiesterase class I)